MSSNSLARLSVELGANTAAFQADMGKAARVAEKELASIKDAASKMGVALGAAAVAAGAAFVAMAKQSIDAADEMNDLSQKLGMSTESLSAYAYAAKMSGADTEAMASGIKKLSSNVVDAARGQGAAKDAFAALGISVKDANGQIKNQDTILREVADKFAGFEDGATKTALAVDIFGQAGADLIPMLDGGTAGLDEMKKEAENLGVILDTKTANAAGAFNDKMDTMKLAMGGAVTRVTAEMLPTMNAMSAQFMKAATDGDFLKNVAEGLAATFKVLVTAGIGLKATLTLIGDTIGQVAAAAVAVMSGEFSQAKKIMTDTTAVDDWKKTVAGIGDMWYGAAAAADTAAKAQDNALGKGKGPSYANKGGAGAGKGAQPKAVNWDAALNDTVNDAAREAGSVQQAFEREKAAAQRAVTSIQQSMLTKRQLLAQDMQMAQQDLQAAVQMEVISEQQKKQMLEQLEVDHKARLRALDEEEIGRKQQYAQMAVSFASSSLSAIAARSQSAAKAGMAIQKAVALNQIRTDTPVAAFAAAKAVAGIPVIGPALAVAAKVAMYAMGAAQAAAVMSGGSTSAGGGGGGFSMSSAASSVPSASVGASGVQSDNPLRDDSRRQATLVAVPADRMMTGRDLVAWLDEAFGDGARLENVRFVTQ